MSRGEVVEAEVQLDLVLKRPCSQVCASVPVPVFDDAARWCAKSAP